MSRPIKLFSVSFAVANLSCNCSNESCSCAILALISSSSDFSTTCSAKYWVEIRSSSSYCLMLACVASIPSSHCKAV